MKIRMTAAAMALCALPAMAQQDDGMASFEFLTPDSALRLAQATLEACRAEGYQVAVAVVDRFGLEQVLIRDRFAGPHTVETATRKAWTAVSFRSDTLALDELTRPGNPSAAIRQISQALPLGGGVPVLSAGSIVGGVGVSGAPTPEADHKCAEVGLEEISDILDF